MTTLVLALAACSKQPDQPPAAAPGPVASPAAATAEHVPCARGTAPLAPTCTLDRQRTDTGQLWTIRFPDGGFRRLRVIGDEISEADGAQPLTADGDTARIGDERYQLPSR